MFDIDSAGNLGNQFVSEDPSTGRAATEVSPAWLNMVQAELGNVVTALGRPKDKTNNAQVIAEIAAMARQQAHTAYDTGGTATAYTVTLPAGAQAFLPAGGVTKPFRLRLRFHAACGANPTLTISTGSAPVVNTTGAIKQYDATGAKVVGVITAGQLADVELDSDGTFVILDPIPYIRGQQTFTASGIFTVPVGITKVVVTICGGGGGGSGGNAGCSYSGAGGGGADTKYRSVVNVTPGQSISVTIGAGGTAGAAATSGGAGGVSSFGALLSASGGGGGGYSANGCSGGTGAGSGGYGQSGLAVTTTSGYAIVGGCGGGSMLGAGGLSNYDYGSTTAKGLGSGYGSGGCGGCSSNSGSSGYGMGAAGQPGVCIVEW